MANKKIRYYITRPGAGGSTRRFWSPTRELQDQGWHMERLPDEEGAAITRAEELNAKLDAWRAGLQAAGNNAVPASDRMVTRSDNGAPALDPLPASPQLQPQRRERFKRGTVGWLIEDWQRTPKWTAAAGSSIKPYAENTKRLYRWACEIIQEWADHGELNVRVITPGRVQKLYEAFLEVNHSKANTVVTVLRILLNHARKRDLVTANAAEKPGMISLPPRLRILDHDEQAVLIAHADALGFFSMGDAIMLGHDMGQREADIIALTRMRYRDGRFFLRPRKTTNSSGVLIDVPATPRLQQRLAAAIARIDAIGEARRREAEALGQPAPAVPAQLVVYEGTFRKYGEYHFREMYARIRAAAAGARYKVNRNKGAVIWNDEDLRRTAHLRKAPSLLGRPAQDGEPELLQANFQDLRDTFVTNAAEGGATIPQICGVSGHTEKSAYNILKHYLALNGPMAAQAIARTVELYEQREAARQAKAASEGEA